ncbi:alpha/beta hydrolase [uncultured Ruegeria sp.]|uniref:alpha/beta fold hydrolase n=1 Tax=uncultured Ruegeria sp. TaxID=259304 RepID=UPI00261E0E46|nr:alpha/beta hydrolase [uncultured Ruegeria sp.]
MELTFTTHQAVTSDGVTLVYKTAGDGPLNLILMGGWGCTRDYYDETLAHMSIKGLRVAVFDLRGHGDSTESPDSYSSARQAADVLAVADAAGMDGFVACGQSMGAKYVQYLPVLAPTRVLGLVLINGCPAGRIDVPWEQIEETSGYAGDRHAMRATHNAMITRTVKHELSEMWIDNAAKISRQVLRETLKHCFYDDFEDKVRAAAPFRALIVSALHDKFFPVDMMQERVTGIIPGAREVYLDCGHEIPFERPAELAIAMESFLAACDPMINAPTTLFAN